MVLKTTTSIWINSFKCVSLHHVYRVEFKEWTEKISRFMEVGSTFKNMSSQPSPWGKYALLSKFLCAMTPNEMEKLSILL